MLTSGLPDNWLLERNQVLESQLAEKTEEARSTKAALHTLAQASSHPRSSRDPRNTDHSAGTAARRVSEAAAGMLWGKDGTRPRSSNHQTTSGTMFTPRSSTTHESLKRKIREDLDTQNDIKRTRFGF
jgi:hypothetical protein